MIHPRLAPFLALAASVCGQSPVLVYRENGTTANEHFGRSLAVLGDLDGDGADDWVSGGPGHLAGRGRIRVFSGSTTALLQTLTGSGTDHLGASVAGAGDFDADGVPDIAILAPGAAICGGGGYAVVRSGRTGAVLRSFVADTCGTGEIGALGDVDLDGFDDIRVATPQRGIIRAYSSRTGTALASWAWANVTQRRLRDVGDVDGDLVPDRMLIDIGGVEVRSGRTRALLYSWPASATVLAGAGRGDMDGDERADVAFVEPSGDVVVRAGLGGAVLLRVPAPPGSVGFGRALCLADVDGDGDSDLVIGEAGRVSVHSASTGLIATVAFGGGRGSFGESIAMGDLDGDGLPELLVGASQADSPSNPEAGAVFVYAFGQAALPGIARRLGAGCALRNGRVPQLDWSARPFVGRSMALRLRAGPSNALALLAIGQVASPLSLASLGAPQCTLELVPETVEAAFTDAAGLAEAARVTIPASGALAGLAFYAQWAAFDATANPLGLVTSSAAGLLVSN